MKIEKRTVKFASKVSVIIILGGCGKITNQREEPVAADTQSADLTTEISGLDLSDGKVQSSTVELKFAMSGKDSQNKGLKAEGFECKFNTNEKYVPCNGKSFVISGLKDGTEYHFAVRGLVRQVDSQKLLAAKEATKDFKVDLSGGDHSGPQSSEGVTSAIASHLQIGSSYQVDIPEGMHVTEYSTSKTTGVLSFFRILPEADPFYLGNFSCNNGWDRVVASISPSGAPLMYCHSTPTRESFKSENEFRLAHNHVEIATDTEMVSDTNHERLMISSFEQDYELISARSRFMNACGSRPKSYMTIPMVPDFFLGNNPEKVKFWHCTTVLPGMDGSPETWHIGAFYDNDQVDWNNEPVASKKIRGIEAVYMAKANSAIDLPEHFAQSAQKRVLGTLKKVLP